MAEKRFGTSSRFKFGQSEGEMKKISKTEQMLLVVLAGVAIMFFYSKKVQKPLSAEIDGLMKTNSELVQTVTALRDEPVFTEGIQNSITEVSKEVDSLTDIYNRIAATRLLTRDKVQEIALEIGGMASNNGLILREMLPTENNESMSAELEKWKGRFNYDVHSLKVEGNFFDFNRFLSEIETMEFCYVIGDLSIQKIGNSGRVEVTCLVLI